MLLELAKRTLVAGLAVTAGVWGVTASASAPPPANPDPVDLTHSSQKTSTFSRSHTTSSIATNHRGGDSSSRETSTSATATPAPVVPKPETKNCRVLLTGDSDTNYQIITCIDGSKSLNLDVASNLKDKELYLLDRRQNKLSEISGFLINNERGWKWRWWGGGWYKLFLPFQGDKSDLWRNKKWQAYRWNEEGQFFVRVGEEVFDLSKSQIKFPYWKTLERDYGKKCIYYEENICQYFQISQKDLPVLLSSKGDVIEVTLQIEKELEGHGGRHWKVKDISNK